MTDDTTDPTTDGAAARSGDLLDDELARRVRAASPLTTRRATPLTMRAEEDLRRLLESVPDASDASTARRAGRVARPRGLRARLAGLSAPRRAAVGGLSLLGAGALATAIAIGITFASPAPSWALTPPPLEATPVSGSVASVLDRLADAAAKRSQQTPSGDVTIRSQSWGISITDDAWSDSPKSWVQPEEVTYRHDATGSGERTFRAGDWRYGVPPGAKALNPGTLIDTASASSGSLTFSRVPASADEFISATNSVYGSAHPTAGDAIAAISDLASEWRTDTPAIFRALAAAPGTRVDGVVTDRLGRRGIAISGDQVTPVSHLTRIAVVSESTGQVLSSETIYRSGTIAHLPADTVISYIAWEN